MNTYIICLYYTSLYIIFLKKRQWQDLNLRIQRIIDFKSIALDHSATLSSLYSLFNTYIIPPMTLFFFLFMYSICSLTYVCPHSSFFYYLYSFMPYLSSFLLLLLPSSLLDSAAVGYHGLSISQ